MRRFSLIFILLLAPGCAQQMAIAQPGPLPCREGAVTAGVDRASLESCVGTPLLSEQKSAYDLHATYVYHDGGPQNHWSSKVVRVLLYTAADLYTLFLTQLLTLPIEQHILSESSYQLEVDFTREPGQQWRARYLEERDENGKIARLRGEKAPRE